MFFSQFPGSPDTGTVYADQPRTTVEDATGERWAVTGLWWCCTQLRYGGSKLTYPACRCDRTSARHFKTKSSLVNPVYGCDRMRKSTSWKAPLHKETWLEKMLPSQAPACWCSAWPQWCWLPTPQLSQAALATAEPVLFEPFFKHLPLCCSSFTDGVQLALQSFCFFSASFVCYPWQFACRSMIHPFVGLHKTVV